MSIEFAITVNAVVGDPAELYGSDVLEEYKIAPRNKRSYVQERDTLLYDHNVKKMVSSCDGMTMQLSARVLEFAGISPRSFNISNELVPCVSLGQCEIVNNSPFEISAGTHVKFVLPSFVSCRAGEKPVAFPLDSDRARRYCRFVSDDDLKLDRNDPLLRALCAESLRIHGDVLRFDGSILVPVRADIRGEVSEREMKRSLAFYNEKFRPLVVTEKHIDLFDLYRRRRRDPECAFHALATSSAVPTEPLKVLLFP